MALTDYTSFDDVRAALGVSKDELSDATLSLDLYNFSLVSTLDSIASTLLADFATQVALPPIWTTPATRFYQAVRIFSTYAVAKQACAALPMFGPKVQTDGKSSLERFSLDPYKVTMARVAEQYEAAKVRLDAAYAAVSTTTVIATSRPYFAVSHPAIDPVTGA